MKSTNRISLRGTAAAAHEFWHRFAQDVRGDVLGKLIIIGVGVPLTLGAARSIFKSIETEATEAGDEVGKIVDSGSGSTR